MEKFIGYGHVLEQETKVKTFSPVERQINTEIVHD